MADIFSKKKRSDIMSRVKGRDTVPECAVRSTLHRLGYRFRLSVGELPGKPDIVLKKHDAVIFVHGCFWHGHLRCRRSSRPSTNTKFWNQKLDKNLKRDRIVRRLLNKQGWRVLTVWECQTKNIKWLEARLFEFMQKGSTP